MDIAAAGKGVPLRDMHDSCRLPSLISNRGRMILESVEQSLKPGTPSAQTDPQLAIWGKARNLNVALPPVNAEIERMNKLRSKLTDRVDLAQMQPTTTLGDVIGTGDDGAFPPNRRGVSTALLRKVHEIEQTIENAPISQLTHWITEAQKYRREEESVEERLNNAMNVTAESMGLASNIQEQGMNEAQLAGLAATINMSLKTIESIRATLLGERNYQELRVAKEADVKDITSKLTTPNSPLLGSPLLKPKVPLDVDGDAGPNADPNAPAAPVKSMAEFLEETAESLKADLFLWVDDIKRNPKSYGSLGQNNQRTAEELLDAELDRKGELPESLEVDDSSSNASQNSDEVDFANIAEEKVGAVLEAARQDGGHLSGIYDAARKAGISLSEDQVKEILKEFYKLQSKQHLSLPQRRKQKIRAERRYIEALMREDSQVKKLTRQLRDARDELMVLEEENDRLQGIIDGYKEGHWEAGELRDRFGKERLLVETMSNKRVKELEGKVAQMEAEFLAAVSTNEDSAGLYSKLKTDYDGLLQLVDSMKADWMKTEEEMQAKQREIEMLRLGRSRDDQLWRSRVLELSKAVVNTVTVLPPVLALSRMGCDNGLASSGWGAMTDAATPAPQQLHPTPAEWGAQVDSRPSTSGQDGQASPLDGGEDGAKSFLEAQLQQGFDSLAQLIETTSEFTPLEALKVQLMEVQEFYDEIMPRSPELTTSPMNRKKKKRQVEAEPTPQQLMKQRPVGTWHEYITKTEYVNKRLIESLQERIEMLATENRGKYREARYMKNMVTYACSLAESIVNGSSLIPPDGLGDKTGHPFPAAHIVAQDRDYAYFWCDERKLLEETLNNLNLFFRHGGTKPNSVNSLITVIGAWRGEQPPHEEDKAAPKETTSVRKAKGSSRKPHNDTQASEAATKT